MTDYVVVLTEEERQAAMGMCAPTPMTPTVNAAYEKLAAAEPLPDESERPDGRE